MSEPYKSICDQCGKRTWYDTEQQCHCTYHKKKECKHCGHVETLDKMERCTGTLRLIDYSELDPRFKAAFESGRRVEVTWKKGFEDFSGYGCRTEGHKARFRVGKSTGWKPIYLMILTRRSSGGAAILSDAVESVRTL